MDNRFNYQNYLIRKKVLNLLGMKFHIFNPQGEVIFFSKMKPFKLKEDIKVYTGEDMQEEIIAIHSRNVIDFAATYDVYDSTNNEHIGSLKRQGMKSILRDNWLILDKDDNQIGFIQEDSLALLRRFLINLIPQKFHAEINGSTVATFNQNFNPFVTKLNVNFSMDSSNLFDKRLGLAAGILLCSIEGKQKS